jgi:AraC-like DNA-binding protein
LGRGKKERIACVRSLRLEKCDPGGTARGKAMKKFFTPDDPILPLHHPRVLVETAMRQGAPRDALLVNTGITEQMLRSPEARVSYAQYGILIHNALELTQNSALGIDYGSNLHLSHMGMLGLAVLSSQNIGEALAVAFKYYRAVAPGWELGLHVEGERAIFSAREAIPRNPFRAFATEALLSAIRANGEFLYGRPIPLIEVRVQYPEPPHSRRIADLYAIPIRYDCDETLGIFDASVLDAPLASADPLTLVMAERQCATELPFTSSIDGLVAQVRRHLLTATGPRSADEIAKLLCTSTRSLRRSLQLMGTSYQELMDEARRARALEWVAATDMTSGEMAQRLGFSDVRGFRRAFRRWTAMSLQQYREERSRA